MRTRVQSLARLVWIWHCCGCDLIRPLVWEPPYAKGVFPPKKPKKTPPPKKKMGEGPAGAMAERQARKGCQLQHVVGCGCDESQWGRDHRD